MAIYRYIIFLLYLDSHGATSEQERNRKSIQILVEENLFKEFNERNFEQQLKTIFSHGLKIEKESIMSYPVRQPMKFADRDWVRRVRVSKKALITFVVSGVEKTAIDRQINAIINVLSMEAGVKETEIEIIQILPCNSCLLVIRLPGLAMVQLIISFLNPQSRPPFCQRLAHILPKSAFEVTFGFASLPEYSAKLPSLRSTPNSGDNPLHLAKHQQGKNNTFLLNLVILAKELGFARRIAHSYRCDA